jgi:hypothetical protein
MLGAKVFFYPLLISEITLNDSTAVTVSWVMCDPEKKSEIVRVMNEPDEI